MIKKHPNYRNKLTNKTKKISNTNIKTYRNISKKVVNKNKKTLKGGFINLECKKEHRPYFRNLAKKESKCSPIFKNYINNTNLNTQV